MIAAGLLNLRLPPLAAGLITFLPFCSGFATRSTGGTSSARYCYSVWLRHLVLADANGLDPNPRRVAELGPGDSLGVGLCALLCGAEAYCAFDAVPHARSSANDKMIDELVEMLRRREDIPDAEFPEIKPRLDSARFPEHILSSERLEQALAPARIERIRASLAGGEMIHYYAPWTNVPADVRGTIDLFLSQAVLEHVDDLQTVYGIMAGCLRDGGGMSHQIDFRAHGTTRCWNGHWSLSDPVWHLVRGRRPYLLNREPLSTHLRLLDRSGLDVVAIKKVTTPSGIARPQLAARFRGLSEDDLNTSGAFLQARRGR